MESQTRMTKNRSFLTRASGAHIACIYDTIYIHVYSTKKKSFVWRRSGDLSFLERSGAYKNPCESPEYPNIEYVLSKSSRYNFAGMPVTHAELVCRKRNLNSYLVSRNNENNGCCPRSCTRHSRYAPSALELGARPDSPC